MEEKSKKGKLIIPIVIAAVLALVGIVVAIILLTTKGASESYRSIKVMEIDGKATVDRASIGSMDAYVNMALESGDNVKMSQGRMTLMLDDDKYVYVEEGAEFELLATGDSANSKTTIDLKTGEITNSIEKKLSEKSTYEVTTPTATMSVRGTVFHVRVYEKDGVIYTDLNVLDGKVETLLASVDGKNTADNNRIVVEGGYSVTTYDDDENIDFLMGVTPLDINDIPEGIREIIDELIKDPEQLESIKEKIVNAIEKKSGPHTVEFYYNGSLFGSQTVEDGAYVSVPSLMPAPTGSWDYDFSQPITEDTKINWIN